MRADVLSLAILATVAAISAGAVVIGVESASAVQLLAFMTGVSFAFVLVRGWKTIGRTAELPSFLFMVGLAFWFYVPLISGSIDHPSYVHRAALVETTSRHAMTALAAINVFAAIVLVAYKLPIGDRVAAHLSRLFGQSELHASRRVVLFLLVPMLLGLGFFVVIAGGFGAALRFVMLSRSELKPWEAEGYSGTPLSFFSIFATALLVSTGSLSLFLALRPSRRRTVRVVLAIIAMLTIAWTAVESGTRSTVLLATLPAMLLNVRRFAETSVITRRGRYVALAVLAVAIVLVSDFQRQYRSSASVEGVSLQVQDNDFFTQTAFAIAVQEIEGRYIGDSAVAHIVSGPVPRALWPDKPVMESMFVFSRYIWGYDVSDTGKNTLPSIVGQYYLNGGWLGILQVGLVLGIILRVLDRMSSGTPAASGARYGAVVIAVYIFLSFRMLSFSFFTPTVAAVVLAAVVARWRLLRNVRVS